MYTRSPTYLESPPPCCMSLTFRPLILTYPSSSALVHSQRWPQFIHSQDSLLLLPGKCAAGRHVPLWPISHTPQRQIPSTWELTASPPQPPRAACPSPRLSGVPGTAGMAPTRKNHHSRRIASAADASSAVQMMIKCYCVRESSKEGLISFIVRKGSTGPPAPNSKAGLTRCMLGGAWVSCGRR